MVPSLVAQVSTDGLSASGGKREHEEGREIDRCATDMDVGIMGLAQCSAIVAFPPPLQRAGGSVGASGWRSCAFTIPE